MIDRDVSVQWIRLESGKLEERRVEITDGHCPACGSFVVFTARTDYWIEQRDGRRLHSGYGKATALCITCNVFIDEEN